MVFHRIMIFCKIVESEFLTIQLQKRFFVTTREDATHVVLIFSRIQRSKLDSVLLMLSVRE